MSTPAAAAGIPSSATPILDRLAPMPPPQGMSMVRVWVELALGVVILIPFFWRPPFMTTFLSWAARNFKVLVADPDWAGVRLILAGFAIAVMCLLAVAIHECGHLLAGLALGFRCREIRFGRFRVDKGFRVSRHQDSGDAVLGWAVMIPQRWENIRLRETLMLLAGPLASFLSGYAVFRLSPNPSLISGSFIGVSFFFAAVNILPLGVQGQRTDGTKVRIMLFHRERALRYLAIRRLTDEIDRGVPLESLTPADLEQAIRLRDTSPETVSAHTLAYLAAFSQKDDAKAAQLLETAFTYSGYAGPSAREMLALQAAMFQAGRRGRIDLAKQWLADVPNTTQYSAWRSKVEAAISN